MKPKRIIIVRHAESAGNIDRQIYATTPDWKVPLTPNGHAQARATGTAIRKELGGKPVGIYLSPYVRTRQTMEEITKSFSKVKFIREDPRLREQEWGNLRSFEKRRWEDIEKERVDFGSFFYRFLHGESGGDVYDRCTGFLDTLFRDFKRKDFPENIIIVMHGYSLRVLLMRWLHWTVDEFHQLKNPKNADFFELKLQRNGKYRLTVPFPKRD